MCFHFLSSNTVPIQAFGLWKNFISKLEWKTDFHSNNPSLAVPPWMRPTTRWVFEGFGSSSEGTAALGATYITFLKKNNLSKSMYVWQMCRSTAVGQIIQAKRGKADPSLAQGPIPGEGRCLQPWASFFNGQGDKVCSSTHPGCHPSGFFIQNTQKNPSSHVCKSPGKEHAPVLKHAAAPITVWTQFKGCL